MRPGVRRREQHRDKLLSNWGGSTLYAGTRNDVTGGELWQFRSNVWSQINQDGFGNPDNTRVTFFSSANFAGTYNEETGCEVYRWDGTAFTMSANNGFGTPDNRAATFVHFYNWPVVGTENLATGCELYNLSGGSWNRLASGGLGDPANTRASSFASTSSAPPFYIGTRNASGARMLMCATPDFNSWTPINEPGFGEPANVDIPSLAQWDGVLFAGTQNASGMELWRYFESSWTRVLDGGGTSTGNTAAISLWNVGNRRYISAANASTGGQVLQRVHPQIFSASPTTLACGQTVDLRLTGLGTHFQDGVSRLALTGISATVNSVTVEDETHAVANITMADWSSSGYVNVITGDEVPAKLYITVRDPRISSFTPASGARGQTLDVTIRAVETAFQPGVSTAVFSGTGITVNSTTVVGSTTIVANITLDEDVEKVNRTVTVVTGTDVARPLEGFAIRYPRLVLINPSSLDQGTSADVNIRGEECSFLDGATQVLISGEGLTINATYVWDLQNVIANVSVDVHAPATARDLTVVTGSDITDTLEGGLLVKRVATITGIQPSSAARGQTLDVTITGDKTLFGPASEVTFSGSGITVNRTTVVDETHAEANVTVAQDAPVGYRTVNVVTDEEIPAPLLGAFSIRAPSISGAKPMSAACGATIDIEVTGTDTLFRQGSSTLVLDPPDGITVNYTTVSWEKKVVAGVTIAPDAPRGERTLNVITGTEVPVPAAEPFLVRDSEIRSVSPPVIPQGEDTQITITGFDTAFDATSMPVFSNPDIAVVRTKSESATRITATLRVDRDAAIGPVDVNVNNNGGEPPPRPLPGGLRVGEYDQSTIGISPPNGDQNQTLEISITGKGTSFVDGKSYVLIHGSDITVNSTKVKDATHATASITISPYAETGPRNVSVVTYYYPTLPLEDGFTVKSGLPVIGKVSPAAAAPGETIVIKGHHFGKSQQESIVKLGGTRFYKYTRWSDTEVRCVVPKEAEKGRIRVTTCVGSSNGASFRVVNTRRGRNVAVSPLTGVRVVFSNVTVSGQTDAARIGDPRIDKCKVAKGGGYRFKTTAAFDRARITVPFEAGGFTADQLKRLVLLNEENGQWIDRTFDRDLENGTITADVTVLSRMAVAYPLYTATWYLAEGSTAWGFDTSIAIENPNPAKVTARVTFMTTGGPKRIGDIAMGRESQVVIDPRDYLGESDFSTRVECLQGLPIAVDRTMTWTGPDAAHSEAHSSIGVNRPAKSWHFAEGSSSWGFECWVLVQNPNDAEAVCLLSYMLEGGGRKSFEKRIPANSRRTFNMAEDVGAVDASIDVSADVPVIAERAMYRNNRREGHGSIGVTYPSREFYLAEGSTAWGFTTYVLLENPGNSEAEVSLTYMTERGPIAASPFSMPPYSRKTIRLNDEITPTDVSTKVSADRPVIAERAMYWSGGPDDGEVCHASTGMQGAHRYFHLPDARTGDGVETWTLVQNPNDREVAVEFAWYRAGRKPLTLSAKIPAASRRTFNMADVFKGEARAALEVRCITHQKKVLVERATYWDGKRAGTQTIGAFGD